MMKWMNEWMAQADELCALGTTCKNLNSDYLNERTWQDLVIRGK